MANAAWIYVHAATALDVIQWACQSSFRAKFTTELKTDNVQPAVDLLIIVPVKAA